MRQPVVQTRRQHAHLPHIFESDDTGNLTSDCHQSSREVAFGENTRPKRFNDVGDTFLTVLVHVTCLNTSSMSVVATELSVRNTPQLGKQNGAARRALFEARENVAMIVEIPAISGFELVPRMGAEPDSAAWRSGCWIWGYSNKTSRGLGEGAEATWLVHCDTHQYGHARCTLWSNASLCYLSPLPSFPCHWIPTADNMRRITSRAQHVPVQRPSSTEEQTHQGSQGSWPSLYMFPKEWHAGPTGSFSGNGPDDVTS